MRHFAIILISLVVFASCNLVPSIDQKKFEPVYRAGKTITGAIEVGVNRLKFSDLLQSFSTELSIVKDKVKNDKERQLVNLYTNAFTIFHDSTVLWDAKIKDSAFDPDIPCSNEVLMTLNRYDLRCVPYKGYRIPIVPGGFIQYFWDVAGRKLREADAVYVGNSIVKSDDSGIASASLYRDLFRRLEAQIVEKIDREQNRIEEVTRNGWTSILKGQQDLLALYKEDLADLRRVRKTFEAQFPKS